MSTCLPLNHFRHLSRLAQLRRCDIRTAVRFLVDHVEPVERNWIDERFGPTEEERQVDLAGFDRRLVMAKIQGLPRNIRPDTDGPYLRDFSFFRQGQGLLGIEAEGVRILDYEMSTHRDKGVYALVKDLLPPMTPEQYRIYNTFNSQFLRQMRAPQLLTMPRTRAMAIDAGCYVGYKALALARFIKEEPVLAFELAQDNFDVLKLNIANNPKLRIEPIRAALSDRVEDLVIHTRNQRTMAHSLTSFDKLSEANTSLAGGSNEIAVESVRTERLDDYTRSVARLSAIHISVNGHEPEVLLGGIESARKADILRVSCPYVRDGRPVRDIVVEVLEKNGIKVFGPSGGAIIAGKRLGSYHLNSRPASRYRAPADWAAKILRQLRYRGTKTN